MVFKIGDKVDILYENKLFIPNQQVIKVGHKWVYVTFGDKGITRMFAPDGKAIKFWRHALNPAFTLRHQGE